MNQYKTVIVGAGLSGISCAAQFVKKGYREFVILEATSRIGGRISSIEISGQSYAAGPSYLHGIKGNPLADIAINKLKLELSPSIGENDDSEQMIVCRLNGKDATNEFISSLGELDICLNGFRYEMTNLDRIDSSDIEFFNSLKDMGLDKALKTSGWCADTDCKRLAEVLKFDIATGAMIRDVSAASEACYQDSEDNHFLIDGRGYEKCLDEVISEADLKKDQILFDCQVVEVEKKETVKLTCKNGKVFNCENVVLALSLNIIKKEQIKFIPSLSPGKLKALENFQMSNYIKVFVEFSSVFWENIPVLMIHNTEEDPSWPDVKHSCRGLVFWQNFDNLTKNNGSSRVLASHISGHWAEKVVQMTEKELSNHILGIFKRAYPEALEININEIKITNWQENEFAQGSFPYAKPGLDRRIIDDLISPELEGRLHLSGDFMDIWHLGTAQAAYRSGINAANSVIQSDTS